MRGKKRGSLGKALSVTPVPEAPHSPCVMVREVQGELEVQPMDRSDHTHDPVQPISLAHRPPDLLPRELGASTAGVSLWW